MPNGVICGGAVEGSNQLGETVTCQAMTTRPEGAAAAGLAAPRAKKTSRTRARSTAASVPRQGGSLSDIMRVIGVMGNPPRAMQCRKLEWYSVRRVSVAKPSAVNPICRACEGSPHVAAWDRGAGAPASDYELEGAAVADDVTCRRAGKVCPDHQERFARQLGEHTASGRLGCGRVKVSGRGPLRVRHLAGMMREISRDHGPLAVGADENAGVAGRVARARHEVDLGANLVVPFDKI